MTESTVMAINEIPISICLILLLSKLFKIIYETTL
jgi:hypothetical protein